MFHAAEVIALVIKMFSVLIGLPVCSFLLYKTFKNKELRHSYPIEVSIVAVVLVMCVGVIPLDFLGYILGDRLVTENNFLCFTKISMRTLVHNVMLMTLILNSVHRIARVKKGHVSITDGDFNTKMILIIWAFCVISVCIQIVCFVLLSPAEEMDRNGMGTECVSSDNFNKIQKLTHVFTMCLYFILILSMITCWVYIVRHIQMPFRIAPMFPFRSAYFDQRTLNDISRPYDLNTSKIHVDRRSKSSTPLDNIYDFDMLRPNTSQCRSSELHRIQNSRLYSNASCPCYPITKRSSKISKSQFFRSRSEMNHVDYIKFLDNNSKLSNRFSIYNRGSHGNLNRVNSIKLKSSVSSRYLHRQEISSSFQNISNFWSERSSLVSTYLDVPSHKSSSTNSYDRKHGRKGHSSNSCMSHQIKLESKAASMSSSHPEFKISCIELDVYRESSKLEISSLDFASRCPSLHSEPLSSISTIRPNERAFTFLETGILSGRSSMEKTCFSKDSNSRFNLSDISFTPSNSVHSFKSNEEITGSTRCSNSESSKVSANCQTKELRKCDDSSKPHVQIKIIRTDDKMVRRRSAIVPEVPLLDIHSTIEQTTDKALDQSPIIASRTQTMKSVSKRMAIGLFLCLLLCPYIVTNTIYLYKLASLPPSALVLPSSLVEFAFAIKQILYVLYNTKIMKLVSFSFTRTN